LPSEETGNGRVVGRNPIKRNKDSQLLQHGIGDCHSLQKTTKSSNGDVSTVRKKKFLGRPPRAKGHKRRKKKKNKIIQKEVREAVHRKQNSVMRTALMQNTYLLGLGHSEKSEEKRRSPGDHIGG